MFGIVGVGVADLESFFGTSFFTYFASTFFVFLEVFGLDSVQLLSSSSYGISCGVGVLALRSLLFLI